MKKLVKLVGVIALVAIIGLTMAGCANLLALLLSFPSGSGTTPRYEVVTQALTWADAKAEAERRGGHLAVITSAAEQSAIESLLTRGESYWIGGYCESDWVWKWVTGEPMNYTNWGSGKNNSGNRMQLWAATDWKWDDVPGTTRLAYIIEYR
jgi:hypothetical protein